MPRLPKSKRKSVTVFIDFNYKNLTNTQNNLHQNVAFVTNYEPTNLTQKCGLTTFYMSDLEMLLALEVLHNYFPELQLLH